MKKLLCILALLLALVCVFVACDENTETPNTGNNSGTEQNGEQNGGESTPPSHTHAYGEWSVTIAATCGAKGEEKRTCTCGESETREIAATGEHAYGTDNKCTGCDFEYIYTEGLAYTLNSDGESYSVSKGTVLNTVTEIILPYYYNEKPITNISRGAFVNFSNLISITLPSSVTSIGDSAFEGCTSLTSSTFSQEITFIGKDAFKGCDKLKQNENGVFYVAKWAVGCDMSVTDAVLRTDTVGIATAAFSGCTNLTSITIPASIKIIGGAAFDDCTSLVSVRTPSLEAWCSIEFRQYLRSYANPLLKAKNLYIGDGTIPTTEIELPDTITVLEQTFAGWNGTSITIPASIKRIGAYMFYGCGNLTSVTFGNNSQLKSIGDSAFCGCSNLANLTIPTSVMSIGAYAFSGCTQIIQAVQVDNSIADGFVLYVDEWMIACGSSLESVVLRAGTVGIADSAFFDCTDLTSIAIPASVKSIAFNAFRNCISLASIVVENGNSVYRSAGNCLIETASKTLIAGCKTSVIPTDGSVTGIGDYAFAGHTELTSITIPASVTSIGDFAFYGSGRIDMNLASVTFAEGSQLTSIGDHAFCGCDFISITIPASVRSIGYGAFSDCFDLASVTFENTSGWWRASSSAATSGTSVSATDLADPATAAEYLTIVDRQGSYYWKCTVE